MEKRLTVPDLIRIYQHGRKISMLTAYDYTFAHLVDRSGVDVVLVGDSLGTVFQGHETTIPVTLDEIIYHTKAVCRGVSRALVVADMPFMSYQVGITEALQSAGRIIKESGASAVKLEGGESVCRSVAKIVQAGIPVMGHLGLTPQSFHQMGGHKVQGRNKEDAARLIRDAKILEESGAFAIVLEGIPSELAAQITKESKVPTIGIGAGANCAGQVLVLHDLLGLTVRAISEDGQVVSAPKFVKEYTSLKDEITLAVQKYIKEVREGSFPTLEHSYLQREAPPYKLVIKK